MRYRAIYSMHEGPQNVRIALLLAGPRRPGPGMLAHMAFGACRLRPHAASQPKRAAQTTCSRAMQARALQSTGGGSTGDARNLVDDHRRPRQKSAANSIDDLCARGTVGEGQHRVRRVGGLFTKPSAHGAHRAPV